MKLYSKSTTRLIPSLVAMLAVGLAAYLPAQTQPGRAEVRAVKGSVVYSMPGGASMPLKVGTVLNPGATIKTSKDAYADLFLGNSAGMIRVLEATTLTLDKLTLTDTGADTVVEVQLNLPEGTIWGDVNKLSAASKYEVKVPNGVAGIRGTRYQISATAYVVVAEGTVVFVYVPPGGPGPTPYTVLSKQYFSPVDGVKPASEDMLTPLRGFLRGRPLTPPGPPAAVPFQDPFVSPGTHQGPNR